MAEIDKDEVINSLKNTICKIVFTKANGETRVMHATLNESILPQQIDIEEAVQNKKPNPDVLAVWDTDVGGWRSFRWDSLKEFQTEFNL